MRRSYPPVYDSEYYKMFNRISFTDLFIVLLVYLESILSFILKLIPSGIINLFTSIINFTINIDDTTIEEKLRSAPTIHEMCALFGITVEDHLVRTEDNYILTIHRIAPKSNNNNGKVVYLHHGLLMCSDIWCCQIERHKNLPFLLHDLGYDVWMGNNRGNKYSTAHLYHPPKSAKFWDFSIDEFAFFDIPNSIEFILDYTQVKDLICIGFSQGSAQMFAALSVNEYLNSKINQLIAIAPAMTPERLHNVIADSFAKSTPRLMYLFFGRNIILPSAVVWQRTIHPHLFSVIIDICNRLLFNWKSLNIKPKQKEICYAKLYSTTSVKCIVHWFQILRSQRFQMFEESDDMFNSLTRPYQIANFPTRTNIKVPILLLYGTSDLLVDIDVMKRNLPSNGVFDIKVEKHEHLDLIWSDDVDVLVFNQVIKFIEFLSGSNESMFLKNEPPLTTITASSVTSTRSKSNSIVSNVNDLPYGKRRRHSYTLSRLNRVSSQNREEEDIDGDIIVELRKMRTSQDDISSPISSPDQVEKQIISNHYHYHDNEDDATKNFNDKKRGGESNLMSVEKSLIDDTIRTTSRVDSELERETHTISNMLDQNSKKLV